METQQRRPTRIAILLAWLSVLALPLFYFRSHGTEEEITYSTFLERLEKGEVEEVTFYGDKIVHGAWRTAPTDSSTGAASPVKPEKAFAPRHFRTRLPAGMTDRIAERLEAKNVEIHVREPGGLLNFLLELAPIFLFLFFWYWIIKRFSATSPANLPSLSRTLGKNAEPDIPRTTFADVAGADEAKEELTEIVEFLKDPERFQRIGGRLPKGVLLVGPPGTGKTLLARAVAGEAHASWLSVSGSEFVEMIVGMGARRVRDLFAQAKKNRPCIIFIDEIDAVGRTRGSGLGHTHDEREQTLNQLLVEMDGFAPNNGVVVLAATNRPDVLDPALLRPGRFDRQVVVGLPDREGRRKILELHARKVVLAQDVDLDEIARSTSGMSGADLANLVNEAALLAARNSASEVTREHFEQARDKIIMGAERKSLVLSETERKIAAYHEAGHALVTILTPGSDPIHKVSIVPRGRALGVTASLPVEDRHAYTRQWMLGRLAILFGGRAAEILVFGEENVTTGAANDIRQATQIARAMVTEYGMSEVIGPVAVENAEEAPFLGRQIFTDRTVSEHTARLVDSEVSRLLHEAHQKALDLLAKHRDDLHRLARALLERETMSGEEVMELLRVETGDEPVANVERLGLAATPS